MLYSSRETIDSYTISVSPHFGILRHRSSAAHSFSDSNYYLQSDARISFLSKEEIDEEKDASSNISVAQLSWSQKASLHEQLAGELPVDIGCSFSQTIFNGIQTCDE